MEFEDEEAYPHMHAMMQWEAKSYDFDLEITENLVGGSDDENIVQNEISMIPNVSNDSKTNFINNNNVLEQMYEWGQLDLETICLNIVNFVSKIRKTELIAIVICGMAAMPWALWLFWFILPWLIISVIVIVGMQNWAQNKLQQMKEPVLGDSKIKDIDKMETDKNLIMGTFLNKKDRVFDRNNIDQIDAMSNMSDKSYTSKIYVEAVSENMKIRQNKEFATNHKENTVVKEIYTEAMLDIKSSKPRFHVVAKLNGVLLHVLADSGATSTACSTYTVNYIESKLGKKLPRLDRKASCKVFGHTESLKDREVVVINLAIGKDVETARCPFIVDESKKGMYGLIGTNVMSYFGFVLDFGSNRCFIQFKKDGLEGIVPKREYIDTTRANLELLVDTVIMEQELVQVPVAIGGFLPESSSGMYKCKPEINALDAGLKIEEKIFNEKNFNSDMMLSIENKSNKPMRFTSGTVLGEINEYFPEIIKHTPKTNNDVGFGAKNTYDTKCVCDLRTDKDSCLIYFANKQFFNAQEHQITTGQVPLKVTEKVSGHYVTEKGILYIRPTKSGKYVFQWDFLKKMITKNTRILFSFREKISDEHEKFMLNLRTKGINVHLYIVKNLGDCFGCISLSNFDCPELFRDIKGTEIYVLDSGTQIENLHRVKAETSPIIEMVFGYYANLQIYRSRKALQIKIHVTGWHKTHHKFRIEVIMGHLLYQLAILKAPNNISIFTSWSELNSNESRQILNALKLSEPWESDLKFDLKSLDNKEMEAPMALKNCNCDMCSRLLNFRPCPVKNAMLNFKGKVDSNLIGSRIKIDKQEIACLQATAEFNEFVEKTEAEYLKMFEETPDYKIKLPPHVDDMPSWKGHERIRDKLYEDEFSIPNADEIKASYHQPVNWRLIVKPEQLPNDPELLKSVEKVLDRFNDMFTGNKSSWRYFNCEPLDAEFVNEDTFVAKSYGMNKEKEYILDLKVLGLFEAGFIYEILSDHPTYITSKLQGFLVRHNSEAKRNEILKKQEMGGDKKVAKTADDVINLDPNDFRLIVNGKPSNKLIKHPQKYKENMPDMQQILNKIGEYNSFITMDISKAYRSLPASERLQRRFAFKCDTSLLKGRVWAFKSVPDGVSLAPSFISYIINKALNPVRHKMPRESDTFVFIDDIIIAARSPENAIKAWVIVMEALEKLNVLISAPKMTVLKNEFQFLGWKIWYDEVEGRVKRAVPDDRKDCFKRMPEPTCKGDIQGAYGTAAFVAPACPGLDIQISQLMDALKLDKKQHEKFELTEIQQRAYRKLLNLLDNLVDLYALDTRKTVFHLSDASFCGLGSLIYQLGKNNSRLPIAYFSKRFPTIIQTQKSSVFKEVLAMFWSVEHHRKTLEICNQVILVVDISSVVSMLRAHIDPTDKQLARISSQMFAWGFNFMLKQSCGYNLVVADFLSRVVGEPVDETGVPFCQKDIDLDQFFKDYADKLPKEWTTPGGKGIFNFEDLITHTTVELLKDSRISESVRQKRLMGLLENIDDRFHPTVLKFLPKSNPLVDMSVSKFPEGGEQDEINICVVEMIQPPALRPLSSTQELFELKNQTKTVKELSPPVTNALTIAYIVELQRRENSTAKVIEHLMTYKFENQHPKIRAKFKLLDSQLLVTKKDNKLEYSPQNVRVYLGPLSALYVAAYLHLCGGHIGQRNLARTFNITFKCYQATSIVKTIVQSCLSCNIYRYPNVINSPEGRIPREVDYPGQMWYVDIVKLDQHYDEKLKFKFSDVIACRDSYSGFVWCCPIKSHKSVDLVNALTFIFTISITPDKIQCDNESGFAKPSFRESMKSWGVKEVVYSTANHSQSNALIECFFSRLRALLWLNKLSFRRGNDHDILYCTLTQLNNAPNWKLAKYYEGGVPPSPANLVFGTAPKYNIIGTYLDNLNATETIKYHERYRKIMQNYEKDRDEQHKNKGPDKYSAGEKIKPGVLVFLRNPKSKHKLGRGQPYFLTEIYEVIKRELRVVVVNKLFGRQRKNSRVNILDVRLVPTRHLVKLLPREVQQVLTLKETDEELKQLKQPPVMLRQRLSPANDYNTRSKKNKPKNNVETTPALKDPLWAESDDEDNDSLFPTYSTEFEDIQKRQTIPFDPNTSMDDGEMEEGDDVSVVSDFSNHDDDGENDERNADDQEPEDRMDTEGNETGLDQGNEGEDDLQADENDIDDDEDQFEDAMDTPVVKNNEEKAMIPDDITTIVEKEVAEEGKAADRGVKRGVGFNEETEKAHYDPKSPVKPKAEKSKLKNIMDNVFGGKTPLKSFQTEKENRKYTSPEPKFASSPISPKTEPSKKENPYYNPSPIENRRITRSMINYRDRKNDSTEQEKSPFARSLTETLADDASKKVVSPTKMNLDDLGGITEKMKRLNTVKRQLDFDDNAENAQRRYPKRDNRNKKPPKYNSGEYVYKELQLERW